MKFVILIVVASIVEALIFPRKWPDVALISPVKWPDSTSINPNLAVVILLLVSIDQFFPIISPLFNNCK
jgi:hypothetical protein